MGIIAKWRDDLSGVQPSNVVQTTGGSANAQTLTTNGSIAALTNGWTVRFTVGAGLLNTSACSLAVDSLAAKNIQGVSGTDLTGGELVPGSSYLVSYYQPADKWILLSGYAITPWNVVAKTSNETRNSSSTLTADGQLLFAASATTKYRFRIVAFFNTSTGGYQFGVSGPASPSLVNLGYSASDSTTDLDQFGSVKIAFGALDFQTGGTAYTSYVTIDGILQNGANAGNVTFTWAQHISDPSATTVAAGSYIEYRSL